EGVFYSTTLNATGGVTPYTWSILSGSLQTGLSLSSTGTISGTPTVVATDTVTIQVQDNVGTTASKTFSLTITGLTITTSSPLPTAIEGSSYSVTMAATGGTGLGYTWAITSGVLQSGLSLSSAGVISGTPTVTGTVTVTINVHDSGSNT